jgi:putative spermidine/putrescine transport system ATP-binding protein
MTNLNGAARRLELARFSRPLHKGQDPQAIAAAKRVALARAFVLEPDRLLLDEPFHSLDRAMRAGLLADLHRLLRETGTTRLFITHDPQEVDQPPGRAIALRDGRMVGSSGSAGGWTAGAR